MFLLYNMLRLMLIACLKGKKNTVLLKMTD